MLAWPYGTVSSRRTALTLVAALAACGPQVELETDTTSGDSTSVGMGTLGGSSPTEGTTEGVDDTGLMPSERQVDILFVVDNSGSMGEEQAKLANAMGSLVAGLEGANPPIDYRVGVTTTDNGNPWCTATTPEAGTLVATSCRQRTSEFVFNGAQTVDMSQEACLDVCPLDTLGITDNWIDVQPSLGTSNVSSGSVEDNLRCMLPQGISGCGFESPLESMWKAIRRSQTEGDSSYGFRRPGALLAVAIITDEVDCSYNNEFESIFLPDGNRVFWSDIEAAAPTSAVCWNAGVSCTGNGTYECQAENYDVGGTPGVDADQAVLRPLERYTDVLIPEGIYLFAIDGVQPDGSVVYADSLGDPQFQNDFGMGPGCEAGGQRGVPPVRMHELILGVSGEGNERSICDADYTGPIASLLAGIANRLPQ